LSAAELLTPFGYLSDTDKPPAAPHNFPSSPAGEGGPEIQDGPPDRNSLCLC